MKKLSMWGKRNPVKTWIIIALCHLTLIVSGIAIGIVTYFEEWQIPNRILFLLVIIFSFSFLFYPIKSEREGFFKYSWSKRIKHDFVMALTYFCILIVGVNHFAFNPTIIESPEPQVRLMIAKAGKTSVIQNKEEIKHGIKRQIKSYKENIRQQIKALKTEWKEQTGKQVPLKLLLILGVIVLAALAFSALGAFACELSCNGYEGAAIVVAIIGTLAIITLSVIAIRAVIKIGKTPEQKADLPPKMVERA